MTEESAGPVSRVLVVTAHPDDVDFGAAGTVASWTSAGIEVTYCICTSGEAGTIDGVPDEEVGAIRRAEQIAAARHVGVHDVMFLGHPDGRVVPSPELRRDITRLIRRVQPQRVLTWSPEINWDMVQTTHPDHRATGEAAFAAVYPDSRNAKAHPELLALEGLEPWTVDELWLADSPRSLPSHAVDITDHFPAKLAALRAHRSQTAHQPDLPDRIAGYLRSVAQRHGLASDRLAEAFQVVNTA
jgi:LmbE family N-acetylglucosaminyl deacetylase